MANATPRNLDPKFKDENPETVKDDALLRDEDEVERQEKEDVPMIVHRERYTDSDGKPAEREHRVPVADWPAYEREHNL